MLVNSQQDQQLSRFFHAEVGKMMKKDIYDRNIFNRSKMKY